MTAMQQVPVGAATVAAPSHRMLNPFIAVVAVAGALLAATSLSQVRPGVVLALEAACLAAAIAEAFRLTVGTRTINVSPSIGIIVAVLVALGPAAAVVVAISGPLAAGFYPRIRPLRKTVFNCGLYAVSAGAAGAVSSVLGSSLATAAPLAREMIQAQAGLITYLVANWGLLSIVLWLSANRAPSQTWREDLRWLMGPLEVTGVIGALVGINYVHLGWPGAILCLVPLVGVRHVLRLEIIKRALGAGLGPAAAP
ncbi:MAG: hypothetical protein ABR573_11110 [Candidatus Dormibacteria bacterium]